MAVDDAEFVDAGIGRGLPEERGVCGDFVVDLGSGVVDLRSEVDDVGADEGVGTMTFTVTLSAISASSTRRYHT